MATVLIANICGTSVSGALFGACVGTLLYQVITKFRSPMFISSCGATVSGVCGALAMGSGDNYLMVAIGGLVILAIYGGFALVTHFTGVKWINKIFPPAVVGSVTMVIGLNLATFIKTYTSTGNENIAWQVGIAIVVMLIVAVVSRYGKGFMKNIPFLFGIAGGYIICLILYACGIKLIDFSSFSNMQWYPDFAFLHWRASDWSWANFGRTCLYFIPVGICAMLEHYSDHRVLSNIIGQDLTVDPGLSRTLLGDGAASFLGTVVCGLPNTSYGESIATTGFSKVASVWVITAAAATLGLMSFVAPIQAFVQSIPACVFGGCAMILYGYIAASGLKTIIQSGLTLNDNKNLIIVSVVLTTGVSGIFFLDSAFTGVALAMVLGVALNLILKDEDVPTSLEKGA